MLELTVRLIVSLAIVVALLMVTARVASRRFRGASGSVVSVLHRQALSRTSSVAVVEVGRRVLVLGTTEHQVNLITELAPDDLAGEVSEVVDLRPADVAFHEHLDRALDQPVARRKPGAHAAPARGRSVRGPAATAVPRGRLAGSVLSPDTWRQAVAAVRGGRAS